MWVESWKKIMSMIRIGRIGRICLEMLKHLQSTGTRRRVIIVILDYRILHAIRRDIKSELKALRRQISKED